MKHLDRCVEKMLKKHCACDSVQNKILLEAISICPECQTLFTTLIYNIPKERMHEVLERLANLMDELGIRSQGMRGELELRLPELEDMSAHKGNA